MIDALKKQNFLLISFLASIMTGAILATRSTIRATLLAYFLLHVSKIASHLPQAGMISACVGAFRLYCGFIAIAILTKSNQFGTAVVKKIQ